MNINDFIVEHKINTSKLETFDNEIISLISLHHVIVHEGIEFITFGNPLFEELFTLFYTYGVMPYKIAKDGEPDIFIQEYIKNLFTIG